MAVRLLAFSSLNSYCNIVKMLKDTVRYYPTALSTIILMCISHIRNYSTSPYRIIYYISSNYSKMELFELLPLQFKLLEPFLIIRAVMLAGMHHHLRGVNKV